MNQVVNSWQYAQKTPYNEMNFFNTIQDITMSTIFRYAQVEFIDTNSPEFNEKNVDAQSNRQIHAAYIEFIDRALNERLWERFGQEEVNAFYAQFKAAFKAYETLDADMANTVLEMIDEDRFRAAMIDRKQVFVQDRTNQ